MEFLLGRLLRSPTALGSPGAVLLTTLLTFQSVEGVDWFPLKSEVKAMVEQIRVQELTTEDQKQDCGCGCGEDQQELVLVSSAQAAEMRQKTVSNGGSCCDGSCGCRSDA